MEKRKRVLLVLFVPSADREGNPVAQQSRWVNDALGVLGTLYGGATAYPRARDIEDEIKLDELGRFCRRLGRETNQGEVGLVIGDEYIAIRDFAEE